MRKQSWVRIAPLIFFLATSLWPPFSALGTVGWETEDIILDFGSTVEDGESEVLLDIQETGVPFDIEITWRLNPANCKVVVQQNRNKKAITQENTLSDDGLFNGNPAHANLLHISALLLRANPGKSCSIEAMHDEFIVMAKPGRTNIQPTKNSPPASLGATVMVMRATAFFTPSSVTVRAGEKVVWIYADGAHEPHSVTSGDCRDLNCTGGGKEFDSGPTLNKPGHLFEHVFTKKGTYPYHCILHLGSMQGTVIVEP